MSLLFLDIDGLKEVNDELGHAAGDRLILAVADSLRARFRQEDQLARWGGDEFCVLLDATDGAGLEAAAGSWQRTSSSQGAEPPRVSVGRALRPAGSTLDLEQLIATADAAMYRARQGRVEPTERTRAAGAHGQWKGLGRSRVPG